MKKKFSNVVKSLGDLAAKLEDSGFEEDCYTWYLYYDILNRVGKLRRHVLGVKDESYRTAQEQDDQCREGGSRKDGGRRFSTYGGGGPRRPLEHLNPDIDTETGGEHV